VKDLIFRRVGHEEYDTVESLYRAVIEAGANKWGWNFEFYPNKDIVLGDIRRRELFCVAIGHDIIGVAHISARSPEESPGGVEFERFWKESLVKPGQFLRICIHPKWQGQGIGAMFVSMVIDEIIAQGFDGVRIAVAVENLVALHLYKKLGFSQCGEPFMEEWGIVYVNMELSL